MPEAQIAPDAVRLPDTPYPGIRPYSYAERDVYFGRKKEARNLIRLCVMYSGVLLYAESGSGKSSLINAGLVPLALTEGLQPHRIRVQPREGEEIVVERISYGKGDTEGFLPSLFVSGDEPRVTLSCQEFVSLLHEKASSGRPLIIFDQFEEWVTLFEEGSCGPASVPARKLRNDIQDAIVSLLRDPELPVKILISLREDYLAKLTPLFKQYPRLTDQYLRLTSFQADQIAGLVRQPYEAYPGQFQQEINSELAAAIQREFQERCATGEVSLTELQIVCRNLLEGHGPAKRMGEFFKEEGGVQGILEQYLERSLNSLAPEQREPAVCLLMRMVTSAGTRNVISREDLLSRVEHEDAIPRELLQKALESLGLNTKLVRCELRREMYYYEISSEFLVGWIRRKALEHERIAEQRKIEAQRLAQEQARRKRRQLVYLTLATVAAVILALIAWRMQARSAQGARHASSLRLALLAHDNMDVDPDRSLLLAIQAATVTYHSGENEITQEAENALREGLHVARVKANLLGHTDSISAIDFSRDGKLLATASEDATIKLWDTDSGKVLATLAGHNEAVRLTAFDIQGQQLASVSADDTLKIWDVPTGDLRQSINLGSAFITALSFSQDGRYVLGLMTDGTVKAWRAASGEEITISKENALKIAPDTFQLAIRSVPGYEVKSEARVSLLDASTGKSIHEVPLEKLAASFMALSPGNNTWLATKGPNDSVTLWGAHSVASSHTLPDRQGGISSVIFSPDGSHLVTRGNDGTLALWESASGELLYTLARQASEVTAYTFSSDGVLFAAGSKDGTARVWDLSRERDAIPLTDFRQILSAAAFSQDGRRVAVARRGLPTMIWDISARRSIPIGEKLDVYRMVFAPDGNSVVVVERNGTSTVWDLHSSEPQSHLLDGPTGNLAALTFRADGAQLIGVTADGELRQWDPVSGRMLQAARMGLDPLSAAAIDRKGNLVALLRKDDHRVVVRKITDTSIVYELSTQDADASDVHFSPRGNVLVTYSAAKGLIFWDAATGRQLRALPDEASKGYRRFTFSADSTQLAGIADEGLFRMWDLPSGRVVRTIRFDRNPSVSALRLASDARHLFLVRSDGELETQPLRPDDLLQLAIGRQVRPLLSTECRDYQLQGNRCEIAKLLEQAEQLAKADNTRSAQEKFALARNRDEMHQVVLDPSFEAKRLAAQAHAETADSLANTGEFDKAQAEFQKAAALFPGTKLSPEQRARHIAGQFHLTRGVSFATSLDASNALAEFRTALDVDPTLARHAYYWNYLCWYGGILRHAPEVMPACETAVNLEPANSQIRDSRGVARALSGNRAGAIRDFQDLVDSILANAQQKDKRRKWIKSLQAGKDPFKRDEDLQALLFEDSSSQ